MLNFNIINGNKWAKSMDTRKSFHSTVVNWLDVRACIVVVNVLLHYFRT